MKIKLLIFFTVIMAVIYLVYQDPELNQKFMGKIHQLVPELNKSTLYKWKNNQGEWQITDKPPGKGIAFKTINSKDQINVISSKPTDKNN